MGPCHACNEGTICLWVKCVLLHVFLFLLQRETALSIGQLAARFDHGTWADLTSFFGHPGDWDIPDASRKGDQLVALLEALNVSDPTKRVSAARVYTSVAQSLWRDFSPSEYELLRGISSAMCSQQPRVIDKCPRKLSLRLSTSCMEITYRSIHERIDGSEDPTDPLRCPPAERASCSFVKPTYALTYKCGLITLTSASNLEQPSRAFV
ncbi:hypothetical protein F4803DRAFT_183209 [Xylaria telfairii]|nr:hypothetical protein F4803DRAFT_183209 [Xylaria telfairii]